MNTPVVANYGKLTKPDGTVITNKGDTITTIFPDGTSMVEIRPDLAVNRSANSKETLPKKVKMKKWPDNPTTLVHYYNLIKPLKKIIDSGYRLLRKDAKQFEYDGYNIGKNELSIFPSPKNQLSEKFLEKNSTKGTHLIDIVLNIAFLLGMEQGRRAERKDQAPTETLLNTLETYREVNKDLRYRIDELSATLSAKGKYPSLSDEELAPYISSELLATKDKRMQEIKKEIQLDQTKSSFSFGNKPKASFGELCSIIETLAHCSKENWIAILEDKGWSFDEWAAKCSKKKLIYRLK